LLGEGRRGWRGNWCLRVGDAIGFDFLGFFLKRFLVNLLGSIEKDQSWETMLEYCLDLHARYLLVGELHTSKMTSQILHILTQSVEKIMAIMVQ